LTKKQLLATEAVPAFGWRLVGAESGIAIGVTVGIFTVLALQKFFEVVVEAADVAGLVHGIIQLFVGNNFRHCHYSLSLDDLQVRSAAVGTFGCETAAFHDALEAEEMAAAKATDGSLLDIFEVGKTN
jgi:hypothetical protein